MALLMPGVCMLMEILCWIESLDYLLSLAKDWSGVIRLLRADGLFLEGAPAPSSLSMMICLAACVKSWLICCKSVSVTSTSANALTWPGTPLIIVSKPYLIICLPSFVYYGAPEYFLGDTVLTIATIF